MEHKLLRALKSPKGKRLFKSLHVCKCEEAKGPTGGVCAQCDGAIATLVELGRIRDSHGKAEV